MPGRVYVQGSKTKEGYTGHELDAETGLNYAGARYYDSAIARWMSVDPLASSFPSHSPYNYVMGDPMRLTDPDGRAPKDIILPSNAADRSYARRGIAELSRTDVGRQLVNRLESSEAKVFIQIGGIDTNGRTFGVKANIIGDIISVTELTVAINPGKVSASERGKEVMPFASSTPSDIGTLNQEFQHASDIIDDALGFRDRENSAPAYDQNINEIKAENTRVLTERQYGDLNARITPMPLKPLQQ
jgi:RHS repeat-associated protein